MGFKKTKVLIMIFAMLCMAFPFESSAATATISVTGSSSIRQGQELSLMVAFSGLSSVAPDGLGSVGPVDISYDSAKYDFKSIASISSVPADFTFSPDSTQANKVMFQIYNLTGSGSKILPSATNIVNVKFTCKSNAQTGVSVFSIKRAEGFAHPTDTSIEYTDYIKPGSDLNVTIGEKLPNNANLASLSVEGGQLTPNFSQGMVNYQMTVADGVTKIVVKAATADAKAKLLITGSSSLKFNKDNKATVTVAVTAQDGTTKKSYIITVIKVLAAVSSTVDSSSSAPSSSEITASSESAETALARVTNDNNNLNLKYNNLTEKFLVTAILLSILVLGLGIYIVYLIIVLKRR